MSSSVKDFHETESRQDWIREEISNSNSWSKPLQRKEEHQGVPCPEVMGEKIVPLGKLMGEFWGIVVGADRPTDLACLDVPCM